LRDRVLAIGDSIRTDVKGAAAYGLDCLFVISGIHADDLGGRNTLDRTSLAAVLDAEGVAPKAVTRKLAW
jgi:ribonucleotide monophosphatase NagD (HAD superfamily)